MTTIPRSKVRKTLLLDIIAVFSLFIIGFITAQSYLEDMRALGKKADFYQKYFEPAVNVACGKGFGVHTQSEIPNLSLTEYYFPKEPTNPLEEFLSLKRSTLSCDELPSGKAQYTDIPQRSWYYLIGTVGLVWKITGISWPVVDSFAAVLYGLTLVLFYSILRLGMGLILAIPLSLVLCLSPLSLFIVNYVRDYAKAPFILAIFLILGLLVKKTFKTPTLILLFIFSGIIVAIGYGFRPDVLITIPALLVTLFFFTPEKISSNLLGKGIAAVAFLAIFYLFSLPIISYNINSGSCLFHFPLLGFEQVIMNPIFNITPRSYNFMPQYNDIMAYAMVGAHAEHFLNFNSVGLCTPSYDIASQSLLMHILKLIPGDLLTRAYSSIHVVLNYPKIFWDANLGSPHLIIANFVRTVVSITGVSYFSGEFLAILTLFMTALFNSRIAIFLLLFLGYFATYPIVQFMPRHFFYLELIHFWLLGFVLYHIFQLNVWKKIFSNFRYYVMRAIIILIVGGCLGIIGHYALQFARKIQNDNFLNLASTYIQAEKKPLTPSITKIDDKTSLIQIGIKPSEIKRNYPTSQMLMISLNDACKQKNIKMTLTYGHYTNFPRSNLSVTFNVGFPNTQKNSYFFTPVFDFVYSHFEGIIAENQSLACFKSFYQVTGLEHFPLWIFLNLTENWKQQIFYQTMLPADQYTKMVLPTLSPSGTQSASSTQGGN